MTRSLLGLAALVALPAWAQEPAAEVLTPYETVVERPLEATAPVSSSSLGVPEASGHSAVAPDTGAPEVTAYDAAMSNAQRSVSPAPASLVKEPLESVSTPVSTTASDSPWAQAVAGKQTGLDSESVAAATNPVEPVIRESPAPFTPAPSAAETPADLAASAPAPAPAVLAAPASPPTPSAAPALVAAPVSPAPLAAPTPLAVPATVSNSEAPAFTPPGRTEDDERRERATRVNAEFHPAPSAPAAKPTGSDSREEARRERREQRTVFGPRRHTRFVGLYGGGSLGAPGFGGPSSGALEVGALVGGALRLGAEFRGLSYGRTGPDVRLASSGFVIGWAFKTRAMIHPTADVVVGGGLVSHQDGRVMGAVGLTAVRGGAELNLTRSVRLTAAVGWRGIAAPNREVRRDLDGFEGLVGVRVGWF